MQILSFCMICVVHISQGKVGIVGRPGPRGLSGRRVRFICTESWSTFHVFFFIELKFDLFIYPREEQENQENVDKLVNPDQR